ncbi:MAG: pseudouridine synthase [Planctomycetota bacterium]
MKSRAYKPTDPAWTSGPERLHKLLARAGFGSRRACEDLMRTGRVTIDGTVSDIPGAKADPSVHDIRVDGERLNFPRRVCYMLNKPPGYICTNDDELDRNSQRAIDLIQDTGQGRLYTVGRLDKDSEGLILVTNDGELTQKMTHPSFRIPRLYRVTVRGDLGGDERNQLLSGVWLAEGKLRPENVRIRNRSKKSTVLELTLTEGKNREIRRIFARVSHPVSRLQRVRIGPLNLGDLPAGQYRQLAESDIQQLFASAEAYRTGKLKIKRDKPRAHEETAEEKKRAIASKKTAARRAWSGKRAGSGDGSEGPSRGKRTTSPRSTRSGGSRSGGPRKRGGTSRGSKGDFIG